MRRLLAALLALLAVPAIAHAFIGPGQTAADFTKNELVGGASGPAWTFYSQPPRVTILFLLGFN